MPAIAWSASTGDNMRPGPARRKQSFSGGRKRRKRAGSPPRGRRRSAGHRSCSAPRAARARPSPWPRERVRRTDCTRTSRDHELIDGATSGADAFEFWRLPLLADFTDVLKAHGVAISMDGKGRCMDNIFVERLWRSLKYEEVYLREYSTVRETQQGLGRYFGFYNDERLHQALGYRTPAAVYRGLRQRCP